MLTQTHEPDVGARQRGVAAGAGVEVLGAVLDHQVIRPVAGMCPTTALHLVREPQVSHSQGPVDKHYNSVSLPGCRER